ncbi:hypothetical protein HCN44_007774 [Aphidius gifuensis]|uniref:Uncharacterized protein n=2 Tax=Aphidius gifuensis TaxID=684658 RepID=A0A834XK31_APHGI|nr:hypothetical protein HCN44_007774 [Aphidius gifuensis]
MPIVAENCKNLTRLEFAFNQRSKVNTDDYIQAFKKLDKLKYIRIEATFEKHETTNLNYKIFDCLPEEMNEIHLIHPRFMSRTPVLFNLKRYKNLHSLTLNGCTLDNIIEQISEQIPLVYLDLEKSSVTNNCMFKETYIFNQLVNLEYFYCFDDWDVITRSSPNTLFNTCKNIKYFNGLTDGSCGILPENLVNLKNLENFTISWKLTDDLSSREIVKHCKNLKYLHMKKEATKFFLQKLEKFKNLECLVYPLCNIDIDSINAIVNNCKQLKRLSTCTGSFPYCFENDVYDDYDYDDYEDYNEDDDDDNGCDDDNYNYSYDYDGGDYDNDSNDNTDYSDDDGNDNTDYSNDITHNRVPSTSILDELSKLEHLEYLNMRFELTLQDSSLIAIANKCKNLEYLNIECTLITLAGLNAITKITSLRRLNVSNNKCVTNSFLRKLKGLNSLNCNRCKKITDVGIIQFIKNCPELKYLSLRSTRMTINTIIAADRATKYRENNIVLHLHGCREELQTACRSIIKSKRLAIYYS